MGYLKYIHVVLFYVTEDVDVNTKFFTVEASKLTGNFSDVKVLSNQSCTQEQ